MPSTVSPWADGCLSSEVLVHVSTRYPDLGLTVL